MTKPTKDKTPTLPREPKHPSLPMSPGDLKRPDRPRAPATLRLTPYAWAKLLFLRDAGPCEVGGFGICDADDLLLVTDLSIPRQAVTAVSVVFDDEAVADHFDRQIDLGRRPEQAGRLWIHTHPGNSPQPSATDEECFARVFGHCDWAVMFILARGGKSFARLRFNVGPAGDIAIPVEVNYSAPFSGSAHADWWAEYEQNVRCQRLGTMLPQIADDEPVRVPVGPFWPEQPGAVDPARPPIDFGDIDWPWLGEEQDQFG